MAGWLSTEIEVGAEQLSAGDWARLVWGLLWRASVLAALAGAAGLGLYSLLAAPETPAATGLVRIAAGAVAVAALPLYLRWLLSARFGTLRLALIRTSRLD